MTQAMRHIVRNLRTERTKLSDKDK